MKIAFPVFSFMDHFAQVSGSFHFQAQQKKIGSYLLFTFDPISPLFAGTVLKKNKNIPKLPQKGFPTLNWPTTTCGWNPFPRFNRFCCVTWKLKIVVFKS